MKLSIELETLKTALEIIDNFAEGTKPEVISELEDLVKQASAKFKVVRQDETHNWGFDEGRDLGTIYGVYLVDTNEVTHCCEITPSYYLRHLYDTCDSPDGVVRDEVESYSTCDDQNIYVHCHVIDAMKAPDVYVCQPMEEHELADNYDALIEGYLEHFNGNHML